VRGYFAQEAPCNNEHRGDVEEAQDMFRRINSINREHIIQWIEETAEIESRVKKRLEERLQKKGLVGAKTDESLKERLQEEGLVRAKTNESLIKEQPVLSIFFSNV
jgi:hypothetical protein